MAAAPNVHVHASMHMNVKNGRRMKRKVWTAEDDEALRYWRAYRYTDVLGHKPAPLLVDMAILLKDRIGSRRRLRIFTDETDAREWLFSEGVAVSLSSSLSASLSEKR